MCIKESLLFITVFSLICIPIFGHIDWWTYRNYDEALTALNSYSIYLSGDWLIPTNEGNPELWNCKPPFLMWCQVISMKCFGVNELAVRLPSAVSVFLLCLLIVYVLYQTTASLVPGTLAALILCTMPGYMANHVARTGDFDAMLTFLSIGYCLLFYRFINTKHPQKAKLLLCTFFFFLLLAVFTKGIAALILLPVIFLFTLAKQRVGYLVTSKLFWLLSVALIILISAYYYYRNLHVPGYFAAMLENEVLGRYNGGADDHFGKWDYYLNHAYKIGCPYWIWFAVSPLFLVITNSSRYKNFYTYVICLWLFHHIIISRSVTKLDWYLAPEYPLLAIAIAMSLFEISAKIRQRLQPKIANCIVLSLFVLTFIYPYYNIVRLINNINDNHSYPNEIKGMGEYLRIEMQHNCNSTLYVAPGWLYASDIKMSIYSYKEKGCDINLLMGFENDFSNKKIAMTHEVFTGCIDNKYQYEILQKNENFIVCAVLRKL